MAEFVFEDGQPIIQDVNAAFEEAFGFDRDEIVNEPIPDVLIPESERDEYDAIVRQAARGERVEREVRRQTTDGLRDFQLSIAPFELDDVRGGYAWHVDITDRKHLAEELQDKANLLDQLFEQLPVSLYVKDREGRHLYLSDLERRPADPIGKTDLDLYPESLARESYEDDMHVIETGEPINNKEEYNEDDEVWTLTSKVPWRGEDGQIKGLIGVTRFITEKKEYEQEIERKNERLENFASLVSHDLRNPLNVAAGNVELLGEEYDDERLETVENALDRMDALIADILELARHGQEAFRSETLSLADIAERAWENVETTELELSIEDDCTFEGDETRVRELIENLLANAVEHADATTITVGPLTDASGFYVEDDGTGIPTEDGDTIFDPGYSTAEGGTGFGLAIVEEIVDGHGWEISVTDSEAGGARFEISGVTLA